MKKQQIKLKKQQIQYEQQNQQINTNNNQQTSSLRQIKDFVFYDNYSLVEMNCIEKIANSAGFVCKEGKIILNKNEFTKYTNALNMYQDDLTEKKKQVCKL